MIEENKEEEKEEWRTIPGNEKYEASNLSQIRNTKTKRILKKYITETGYERIGLYSQNGRKNNQVHRLVAQAFIPNPNNFPQVNHKDKNRANNKVENLEWATASMNVKHSIKMGVKRHKRAVWQRDLEGNEVAVFDSITKASEITGCDASSIIKCANGKRNTAGNFTWGYVKEKITEEVRGDNWKEIKNYPGYRIYNNGQIYSDYISQYLKLTISGGYYRIGLCNDNGIQRKHQVHILVAQYFCDNSENKPIVNHIDGDKLNNHYTNLEWVTQSENMKHADSLGLIKRVTKRVLQYAREDKDKCEPLHIFNSAKEVADFVKSKSKTKASISSIMASISTVCTGVQNTAYGYRWEYEKPFSMIN
uniref:HNH endonuclease n=1 Tax=Iridovirus LCIVAC01 TaxID=2506607 RepID=A0A481YQC9_9VIRU|nr:MAG: HNH endonuclease [Iridovirus LCIVAC01]